MLKLKKSLNKEILPEFIEKDEGIKYTNEDVTFYNNYLDKEDYSFMYHIIKLYGIMFGTIIVLGNLGKLNGLWEIFFMGILFTILVLIDECKEFKSVFKSFGVLYKLQTIKKSEFNNHYFLKQKISKHLEDEKIKIDDKILNKLIKKYPEKKTIKDYLNNETLRYQNEIYKYQIEIYNEYKVVMKYLDK